MSGKIKVKKIFNNRIFELTQKEYELWVKAKIPMVVIEAIQKEEIPDVLIPDKKEKKK